MARTSTPEVLWSDCIVMEAEIISHTAKPTPLLNGLTPQSLINPETPDISRIAHLMLNSSGIHGYGGMTKEHRSHNQRRRSAVTWDQRRTLDQSSPRRY
jgi:hypothetical protein